jgi:PEP-CTERM motif
MKAIASPRRSILAAAIVSLTAFGAAFTTEAATITWGAAQNIAGDSDVDTTGTFLGAANFNGIDTTVNGVLFTFVSPFGGTTGPITLAPAGNVGSLAPGVGSASYDDLLYGSATAAPAGNVTLTLTGLTVGETYLFQWWSNWGDNVAANVATTAGGASLQANVSNLVGGAGQFQIGTFIADNATQQVIFTGTGGTGPFGYDAAVSGAQLRQLAQVAPPSPVPEPGSALVGMLGLGLCGLGGARRRRA